MINADNQNPVMDSAEERRRRFLEEFEKPFKCEKCNERFKKKKYLREHKSEVHSYWILKKGAGGGIWARDLTISYLMRLWVVRSNQAELPRHEV